MRPIGLSSQQAGDEMFGSSRIARRFVRVVDVGLAFVREHTPMPLRRWFNSRFDTDKSIIEQGAAFDLLRASVNLCPCRSAHCYRNVVTICLCQPPCYLYGCHGHFRLPTGLGAGKRSIQSHRRDIGNRRLVYYSRGRHLLAQG